MKNENKLFYDLCLNLLKEDNFNSKLELFYVFRFVEAYQFYFIENQLPFEIEMIVPVEGTKKLITLEMANNNLQQKIIRLKKEFNISI